MANLTCYDYKVGTHFHMFPFVCSSSIYKGGRTNKREQTVLLLEAACLFLDEGAVVEVVDFHGATHLVHCLAGGFASYFATLAQYLIDGGNVLLVLGATLTDGFEHFLQHGHEEFLALHVT